MTPEDDVCWPRCPEVIDLCPQSGLQRWCSHTREIILSGGDEIEPGMRHCVPISPDFGMFAEVAVEHEMIGGIMASVGLVKSELFSFDEEIIDLGLWTKGEGRLVLATMIVDFANAHLIEKCTARSHVFKQEIEYQQETKSPRGAAFEKANKWCLFYYGHCLPCHKDSSGKDGGIIVNFDASSTGLDRMEDARPGVAMDYLKAKYKT